MKQRHLILQNILTHGACVTVDRDSWSLEITRHPRESCVDRWRIRNSLRTMEPGTRATINGFEVYRKKLTHQAPRYAINGRWYDTDKTIAILESIQEEKSA